MVRCKADNQVYAMKIMSKKNIYAENMAKHVRLEKEILATVGNSHPFVVGLRFAFQTPRALCLVIEYLSGGSLFHHLRESEAPYSRQVAQFYAVEILLALEALHTADFIYRDLKLENCLLDSEGISILSPIFSLFFPPPPQIIHILHYFLKRSFTIDRFRPFSPSDTSIATSQKLQWLQHLRRP